MRHIKPEKPADENLSAPLPSDGVGNCEDVLAILHKQTTQRRVCSALCGQS